MDPQTRVETEEPTGHYITFLSSQTNWKCQSIRTTKMACLEAMSHMCNLEPWPACEHQGSQGAEVMFFSGSVRQGGQYQSLELWAFSLMSGNPMTNSWPRHNGAKKRVHEQG